MVTAVRRLEGESITDVIQKLSRTIDHDGQQLGTAAAPLIEVCNTLRGVIDHLNQLKGYSEHRQQLAFEKRKALR